MNRLPIRKPVMIKVLALPYEGALQLLVNAPLHQAFAWHLKYDFEPFFRL